MTITPTHPTRTLRRTLLVVIGMAAVGVGLIALQVVVRTPLLSVVIVGDFPAVRIAAEQTSIEEARWVCAPEHPWLHTVDRRTLVRADWERTVEKLLPGSRLEKQLSHATRGDSITRRGRTGPSLTGQTARLIIRRPDGSTEHALALAAEIRVHAQQEPRTYITILQGLGNSGAARPIDAVAIFAAIDRTWFERLRGDPEYRLVCALHEALTIPDRTAPRPPGSGNPRDD